MEIINPLFQLNPNDVLGAFCICYFSFVEYGSILFGKAFICGKPVPSQR